MSRLDAVIVGAALSIAKQRHQKGLTPMTEEVTDAMLSAGMEADGDWMNAPRERRFRAIYLAMEAARVPASNSPTTNGEVERRVLRIEWDDARPVAAVYEQDGIEVMRCSIATNLTPRAASDDEVERIIEDLSDLKIAAPVLGFMGLGRRPRLVHEIHELANEAAAVLAALTHHSDLTKG